MWYTNGAPEQSACVCEDAAGVLDLCIPLLNFFGCHNARGILNPTNRERDSMEDCQPSRNGSLENLHRPLLHGPHDRHMVCRGHEDHSTCLDGKDAHHLQEDLHQVRQVPQ